MQIKIRSEGDHVVGGHDDGRCDFVKRARPVRHYPREDGSHSGAGEER
jgi:hypothetical protein